jgi:hypothetical protein
MSFFHCLGRTKESSQVRGALKHFVTIKNFYGEELSAPRPTFKLEDHPCWLSATTYSIYSQLPSVSRGLPSIRNLRTRHAVVSRDPPNMDQNIIRVIKSIGNGRDGICSTPWWDEKYVTNFNRKSRRKRPLRRSRCTWEDNIKTEK